MDRAISTPYIDNWREFRRKTFGDCKLLKKLGNYPEAILVSGCQRSGTTMLSRVLTESEGMVNYWFGHDDELDAALILSGLVKHEPRGRYCFQTTYVDHCYGEYFEHSSPFKVVWVLRNPYSTVYSLVHNWPQENLERTFRTEGAYYLDGLEKLAFKLLGNRGFSKLKSACFIYNWKLTHLFQLYPELGRENIMVVDYDELVLHKERILPAIYAFVDLLYKDEYSQKIHSASVSKKQNLSEKEYAAIEHLCEPIYTKAKDFLMEYQFSDPVGLADK